MNSLPGCADGRRGSRRIFNDTSEEVIAAAIRSEPTYPNKRVLQHQHLRAQFKEMFSSATGLTLTRSARMPAFSDRMLAGFKRRRGFSTVSMKLKQRKIDTDASTRVDSDAKVAVCHTEVRAAIQRYGAARVFNMDEMPGRVVPRSVKTLHDKKRTKSEAMHAGGNERKSITTVVTVAANGTKLPLVFVVKGKTVRCGADVRAAVRRPHIVYQSPSGWMNHELMVQYYRDVILPHTHGEACALLMDDFGAHWKDEAIEAACDANVQLLDVPAGRTFDTQPLDVGVNNILQNAKSAFWAASIANGEKISDAHIVQSLQQAYAGSVSRAAVQSAWMRACGLKYDDIISSQHLVARRVDAAVQSIDQLVRGVAEFAAPYMELERSDDAEMPLSSAVSVMDQN